MNRQPVALVTGGSRGIGRACCLALGREGFTVVVNYNSNADAANDTRAAIESAGGQADICQADVGSGEQRDVMLQYCWETFGRLDLLVNNAGVAPAKRADILDMTEDSYDRVMDTNLKGPFLLSQAVARMMVRQINEKSIPSAAIINISSISAYTASINRAEYCISKAGLSMVTQLLAARLAEHNIRVYEVRPGVIATDMTGPVKEKYDKLIREGLSPIARWGKPEDIARAVAMLARGDLPFSTGEVINVDGGFHMRRL